MEKGRPFQIQIAGETIRVPADAVFTIEHEREGKSEEIENAQRAHSRCLRSRLQRD